MRNPEEIDNTLQKLEELQATSHDPLHRARIEQARLALSWVRCEIEESTLMTALDSLDRVFGDALKTT